MGLFDGFAVSVQTSKGTFALGGAPAGSTERTDPQPSPLTPAGDASGLGSTWAALKRNPLALLGLAAGAVLLLVLILRR